MNWRDKLVQWSSSLFGERRKTWTDICVAQWLQLAAFGDDLQVADALRIVYGVELANIPVSEVSRYSLEFLKNEPKREPIRKMYKLRGRKYRACFDTTKLTTAQFADFQNYQRSNDFVGCIAVCMIPKGHEYNDGYSMEVVRADVESMRITQALTIAFFFKNQLAILLVAIQHSLGDTLDTLPEMREFAETIKQADLVSLLRFR